MSTAGSLCVLLANVTLAGHTGTETATRDLALGLEMAGHQPMVFAPALGDLADPLRAAGIPVVDTLADLPASPDVIHGHHHVETLCALLRFPSVPALFVCHDRHAAASAPPRLARIRRYVAVDLNCLERLRDDYAIPTPFLRVIPNAVDLTRFQRRAPLPARPVRAAVFSNNAGPGTHLEFVREACADAHLSLDVIGAGVGRELADPERLLGDYDLVFAKGRAALEALAVGTAVILCDTIGLGPLVTTSNVDELRRWNLGQRLLTGALDAAAIRDVIRQYDAADAGLVCDRVRAGAGLDAAVARYVALYREVLGDPIAPRSLDTELAEYLIAMTTRVRELEQELASYRRPMRMPALSDRACEAIDVRIVDCPATVATGAAMALEVRIDNRGDVPLGTFPPWPIHLSYRWIDPRTGTLLIAEGPRTPIPSIAANGGATCVMRVTAPDTDGDWRLRVVLVQEGLRWLDQIERPLADERGVGVTPPVMPA